MQSMLKAIWEVPYVPTLWTTEKQRSMKRKKQLDCENIQVDITDFQRKNVIQQCEARSPEIEFVYLTEFVV